MAFFSESLLLLLLALVVAAVHGKMGYFWHITDLHWDTHYNTESNSCWRGLNTERGEFGDHNCDSPWSLVQSAVRMMRAKNGDNIEFVFWTGDALSRGSGRLPTHNIAALQNLTTLLRNTFNSQFVFPVLGHDDPPSPYRLLSSLWRQWLPNEALYTFSKGGYYTIEQKMKKLRLILLNTNLWVGGNSEDDPGNQWAWLEEVLDKSQRNKETVYLVGHTAPGADERQITPPRSSLLPKHNERYLQLVRQYSDIITGQFFGHLHSDTFRIVYNSEGSPVSWMFLAPSVTPRRSQSGANNPALRLYKFDTDTGQVQDYIQYYLDLGVANREHKAEWQIEYNITSLYGLQQISPQQLHELAESFTIPEGFILFARYYLANSVQSTSLNIDTVNQNWAHNHYCAIVNLDYRQYQNCLATAASALAASSSLASSIRSPINILMETLISIFIKR